MDASRHVRTSSLREVWLIWSLFGLVATAIFATYARLPVGELYHVSGNGRWAAAGRVLVFLNWPTALAAIALVGIVPAHAPSRTIRRLSVLSVLLCSAVAWPGMVKQVDLDARWPNLIPASGVLLALALTIAATGRYGLGPQTRVRGDRLRLVAGLVLLLLALEWIVADLGFLIGRWPVLGSIFYSDEWWARLGHARLEHAVHHGHHHGMDGTLLALTAIVLSRTVGTLPRRLRIALGVYLAVLLAYGLAVAANDFWLEQVVKRDVGVTWEIPSVIVPRASFAWLAVLALAAVFYVVLVRTTHGGAAIAPRRLLWPGIVSLVMTVLIVVGLVHGPKQHRTRLARADGIAFTTAPNGTPHTYVLRRGEPVRVLPGYRKAELAPSWSKDRRLVFQSRSKIYLLTRDGPRAVTNGGEPHWHPNGRRIAFVRNGDLYVLGANGGSLRKIAEGASWPSWSAEGSFLLYESRSGARHGVIGFDRSGHDLVSLDGADLRYPAWSPRGRVFAYECLIDDHWHICVDDHALTHGDSNDFAPAWSPNGRRIAFISDRDGNDQVFVMRADGTGVLRLTSGQAEKDTPVWLP